MRFMMLLKADKNTEAGLMPGEDILIAMGKYNEELIKAGALLAGEGLQPSSKGARVRFANGKSTVIDGPFTETKELIAGFWMIQVKSKEEAIEWARRVPFNPSGASATTGGVGEIEIRQVFEDADFSPDLYPSEEAQEVIKAEGEFRKRTNT
ncbi:MAG: YciI family protein [Gemmatimonadota bacterium]